MHLSRDPLILLCHSTIIGNHFIYVESQSNTSWSWQSFTRIYFSDSLLSRNIIQWLRQAFIPLQSAPAHLQSHFSHTQSPHPACQSWAGILSLLPGLLYYPPHGSYTLFMVSAAHLTVIYHHSCAGASLRLLSETTRSMMAGQVSVRPLIPQCRFGKRTGWCWKGTWQDCRSICWAPASFQELLLFNKSSIHYVPSTVLSGMVTTIIPILLMRNLKHWEAEFILHVVERILLLFHLLL